MEKTSTGLEENIAGLLCYILWWVSGFMLLLLEPKNKFIRFHAMQSIIVFGALSIVLMVFSYIPFFGWFAGGLLGGLGFVLWVVLMFKAYQGTTYKLPVAGGLAEQWLSKPK